MLLYGLSVVSSFCAVFLKGFQYKNVIGNHTRSVFFTSFLMAAFDVAAITLVVKGDWTIAISAGCGAAVGMVASMKFHDKIFGVKVMPSLPLRLHLEDLITEDGINFDPILKGLTAIDKAGNWPKQWPHLFTVLSHARTAMVMQRQMHLDRTQFYKDHPEWKHEELHVSTVDIVVGLPEHHPNLAYLSDTQALGPQYLTIAARLQEKTS